MAEMPSTRHHSCLVTHEEHWHCLRRERYSRHLRRVGLANSNLLSNFVGFLRLLTSTLRRHALALLGISLSLAACKHQGFTHQQLVDNSFFKSVGVLLAMLLSLRARAGVANRQRLIEQILMAINSARTLLALVRNVDSESGEKLHEVLAFSYVKIGHWFSEEGADSDDDEKKAGPPIEHLPEEFRVNVLRMGGMTELGASPRPLIAYIPVVVDRLLIAAGHSEEKTRFGRLIDNEVKNILVTFDSLCVYDEEVHPDQIRTLLEMAVFAYTAMYPWCVKDEAFLVLATTTIGICLTFYGLHSVTHEIIHPLGKHGQGIDLVATFVLAFSDIREEEQLRKEFMKEAASCKPEVLCEDFRRQTVDMVRARMGSCRQVDWDESYSD